MFQAVNQWDLSKICFQSKKCSCISKKSWYKQLYLIVYTDFILHQKKDEQLYFTIYVLNILNNIAMYSAGICGHGWKSSGSLLLCLV